MGPDEYHAKVDNNVYTNIVAALAIYMADFRWLHITRDTCNTCRLQYVCGRLLGGAGQLGGGGQQAEAGV